MYKLKAFSQSLKSKNFELNKGFQFYLPQRAISVSGKSSEMFMQKLANYLNCKLNFRTLKEGFSQYVINTSSKESNNILVKYLESYPLLSSKFLDFKD